MKNYLIIGGSSGIGRELTEMLSQKGHKVYATYFNHPVDVNINNVNYQHYDVMNSSSQLEDLPEEIHGVVYCPGNINLKPFKRVKKEALQDDLQLHVLGAVDVLQQVIDKMKNVSNASIVMFSSVAVQTGFSFHTHIGICKGAIEGLVKSLSAEYAPTIRVNCIAPSLTHTSLAENLLNSDAKIEANSNRHPMKRVGKPVDMASMAAFLLSDESSWMTGQIIKIDGGISSLRV